MPEPRAVAVGAVAGVVALTGMAGWALLGVTLLGLGAATAPAAVALAVGGSAGITQDLVSGSVSVLPLGVSLVGALLFATVLTSWPRVAGAVGVFVAGLFALPFLPAGQLDVRFWPTLFGGIGWLVVVVGVRVAIWWFPRVRRVVAVLMGAAGFSVVVGVVASAWGGARMLGTMVLAAPNLLCVALTRGFGVPWQVHGTELPLPTIETGAVGPLALPEWPLAMLAAVVVVLVAVAAGWHTPWVAAVCFAAMAAFGGAALDIGAGLFRIELGVSGDVLVAAAAGLAAGTLACLLVAAGRSWHRRRT
ncbi:hypothetical protein [Actinophytocola glycyrrhizae]|uniref:Uncharacterized protein n=1 Tax=Actinophytocola glycyrrhizae TaxID=2044873 RepID=A0ABV9RUZ5_9PSEU